MNDLWLEIESSALNPGLDYITLEKKDFRPVRPAYLSKYE